MSELEGTPARKVTEVYISLFIIQKLETETGRLHRVKRNKHRNQCLICLFWLHHTELVNPESCSSVGLQFLLSTLPCSHENGKSLFLKN